jgi:hypothetical protein
VARKEGAAVRRAREKLREAEAIVGGVVDASRLNEITMLQVNGC